MPNTVPPARYRVAMLAALAGLAIAAAPTQRALGDKPSTPVTVVRRSRSSSSSSRSSSSAMTSRRTSFTLAVRG